MVDGGSENNNSLVDGYVNDPLIPIKKIIAQHDIQFSNSIVEAVNKVVKYRFLRHVELFDFHNLKDYLTKAIPLYNSVQPHYSLHGLTPEEAFRRVSLDRNALKARFIEAKRERIAENTRYSCGVCPV
jgi:putative transposase